MGPQRTGPPCDCLEGARRGRAGPLHGRFEVEQLLRFERGTGEYLVKWRGYDAWEATWEPRERLASQCTQ